MHTHNHMHTHARPHVYADLYHNLHNTERLCVSGQHWDIISLSATITTMKQKLIQIFIYYIVFLDM